MKLASDFEENLDITVTNPEKSWDWKSLDFILNLVKIQYALTSGVLNIFLRGFFYRLDTIFLSPKTPFLI